MIPDDYKKLTKADIANMRLDIKFLRKQYKRAESAIKETCDGCAWDDTQVCAECRFAEWRKERNGMACKCAKPSGENHGWECEVSGGGCVFVIPDSKLCAALYGEGPDATDDDDTERMKT